MKLPSKSTPYENSIISLFPIILSPLKEKDCSVLELYKQTALENIGDYVSALDCLYALGKVEMIKEGGLLHYVG